MACWRSSPPCSSRSRFRPWSPPAVRSSAARMSSGCASRSRAACRVWRASRHAAWRTSPARTGALCPTRARPSHSSHSAPCRSRTCSTRRSRGRTLHWQCPWRASVASLSRTKWPSRSLWATSTPRAAGATAGLSRPVPTRPTSSLPCSTSSGTRDLAGERFGTIRPSWWRRWTARRSGARATTGCGGRRFLACGSSQCSTTVSSQRRNGTCLAATAT
mmetsp:Transcript_80417/g.247989  ORF Transcript_80417/g.247989 Transcript_80417/m.247989 type:complete len:218 (+) Transcript_80417:789-1442(+)